MRTYPAAGLGVVAILSLAPLVGGCGFTPLYAAPGVSSGLSTIDIVVPQGRVAYLLREDLDDALAHDKTAAPTWRLDLTLSQTRSPRGLGLTDVAERYDLGLTVKYTLTDVSTGKVVHTGQVTSQVSYDEANAPYAGIAARQDSQDRVASDAARRIQIELAAWLARHPGD
jgi:LPS-assembly lipoprotein